MTISNDQLFLFTSGSAFDNPDISRETLFLAANVTEQLHVPEPGTPCCFSAPASLGYC